MLDQKTTIAILKAAAEPTRLRMLVLLSGGELNVKDLTRILGQSQPRISRHLKLMSEAGLVERLRDGSWVYFHWVERGACGSLVRAILDAVDPADPMLVRDRKRAEAIKHERELAAQSFFEEHAGEWDRIRSLHVAEAEVETALRETLGAGPFHLLADLGTGTGRVLELMADRYQRGVGFDLNHAMLAYARGKLERAALSRAAVRQGDLYDIPLADTVADAVIMHQVLHFLAEPALAIREAARILAPGGRLAIVDFAPHDMEFLREAYAHERLGFSHAQIATWLQDAGLKVLAMRDLPGVDSPDGSLTVTIWSAEREFDSARHPKHRRETVEV